MKKNSTQDKRFPVVSSVRLARRAWKEMGALLKEDEIQQMADVDAVDRAIQVFNLGVQAMFPEGSAEGMSRYCTAAWQTQMASKYSHWRSQGVGALELAECRFLAADLLESDAALAFTYEHWNFCYEDGTIHRTSGAVDGYQLLKRDGLWLVNEVVFYHKDD